MCDLKFGLEMDMDMWTCTNATSSFKVLRIFYFRCVKQSLIQIVLFFCAMDFRRKRLIILG